jgi:MinD superfamily P-loop ATPase
MSFLDTATRYLFFAGKGGVGKTSIVCATAGREEEVDSGWHRSTQLVPRHTGNKREQNRDGDQTVNY